MYEWAVRDDGATAVEYSIMAAAIAAVVIAIVFVIGGQSCRMYAGTSSNLAAEMTGSPSAAACS